MQVGDRLRELRKHYGLNQTEFGDKIGLKQTAIGQMENNTRSITDRTIMLLREKYNANENWLLNGTGNMFIEPSTFSLDEYAKSKELKETEINLIRGFMELDPNTRNALYDLFKNAFATEHDEKNVYEDSPKTPDELEKAFPPVDPQGDKDTNVG
jgi:transcriptional regulator with XRE-family HTH domain